MDKVYAWTYSLDKNKLLMASYDIDKGYQGLYEPGDRIKILKMPNMADDDYVLLESEKIDTDYNMFKDREYGDCLLMYSYSDNPVKILGFFESKLIPAVAKAQKIHEDYERYLSNVIVKKAKFELKHSEDNDKVSEEYEHDK